MAENQSFQSLFQLAVALNIGFVAIATVYGSSISKEKARIEELSVSSTLYRDHCIENKDHIDEASTLIRKIVVLRRDLRHEMSAIDKFVDHYCRPIALVSAGVAFAMLTYSSFNPAGVSVLCLPLLSLLVNLPLIGFIAYAYYRSVNAVRSLAKRRHDLDEQLSAYLLNIAQKLR